MYSFNSLRRLLLIGLLVPFGLFAAPPQTFQQAKRIADGIFADHRLTLYCQCRFDAQKAIDLARCQMQSAADKKRAKRVEFEHMLRRFSNVL